MGFKLGCFWKALLVLSMVLGCSSGKSEDGQDAGSGDAGRDAGRDSGATASEPDDSFFDPVADESLVFTFKGRINDAATAYEQLKVGEGDFKLTLDGGTDELTEGMMALADTFPADAGTESLRGEKYVALAVYKTLEGTSTTMTAEHVNVYAIVDDLMALKKDRKNLMPIGRGIVVAHKWFVNLKMDGSRLDRVCTIGFADPANKDSRYFVDTGLNKTFGVGEVLALWGNVGLETDPAAIKEQYPDLEDYEGLWCQFLKDNATITKDEYVAELASDDATLSCDMPQGYLDPFSADHLAVTFKGAINDAANQYPAYGAIQIDAEVDGGTYGDAVYSTYAYKYTDAGAGTDYVAASTMDDVVEVSTRRYTVNLIAIEVARPALVEAKASGEGLIANDQIFAYIAEAELIYAADGTTLDYQKICPVAVNDPASTASSAFVCAEGNTDFSIGETLELASNLALTTDPAVVGPLSGVPEGETCICQNLTTPIPCADFPGR